MDKHIIVYLDYKYIYSDTTNAVNELQLQIKTQTDPEQKKWDNDIVSHTQTHIRTQSYCIFPFIQRFKSGKVLGRDTYLVFKTIRKTKEVMVSKVWRVVTSRDKVGSDGGITRREHKG